MMSIATKPAPGWFIAVVAAACLAIFAPPARADEDKGPQISVSGQARIDVAPDMAEISGGVTSEAREAASASAANAAAMAKIIAALKAAGIAGKDIRTTRFSIQPIWPPKRVEGTTIIGYRASNQVSVKVRDISRAAPVLDALVSAGANNVGGIHFFIAEPDTYLDKARAAAMADAKRKAEIYARAAGLTLGMPIMISEGGAYVPRPVAMRAMAPADAEAVLAPGEQTLSISVSVTYQLKEK